MPIEKSRRRARFAFLLDPALQNTIRVLAFLAAALMVASLFYMGRKPIAVNLFPSPYDSLAHMLTFGALTFLLWLAAFRAHPVRLVLLVALVGALDEGHQMFLPGRSPGLGDWLFDVAAAVIVVSVLHRVRRVVL